MKKRTKAKAHEKTRARQTGASIKKLRTEQAAADSLEALAVAAEMRSRSLKEAFTTDDGDFDLDAFKRCLKDNDVQAPKIDESKPGWRGRFRMCAGISLRAALRKNGSIVIAGKKLLAMDGDAKRRGRKAKQAEVNS